MSKPLIADPKRVSEAAAYHRAVFAEYGGPKKVCALCGKPGAVDAAHVVPRSMLGPLRYADPRMARPAHRACHEAQERGDMRFSLAIRRGAVLAHNEIAKVPLVVPDA